MSTATTQELTRTPRTIPDLLRVPDLGARLAMIAPAGFDGRRLARELAATLRENPALRGVTVDSLLISVSRIASLGLSLAPASGECFLIPRRDKTEGNVKATLQIGRNGWLALALRNPRIVDAWSNAVYERDVFKLTLGGGFNVEHVPETGDRGQLKSVYAVAKFEAGGQRGVYLSRQEVLAAKAMADQGSLAWKNFEPMMWEKVCLKRLCKTLAAGHPLVTAAIAVDDGVHQVELPVIEIAELSASEDAQAGIAQAEPLPPQPEGTLTVAHGPSFAEIAEKINAAITGGDFNLCRDLARSQPEKLRDELNDAIDKRLKELAAQAATKKAKA